MKQTFQSLPSVGQQYGGSFYVTYGPFECMPHVLVVVVGEIR